MKIIRTDSAEFEGYFRRIRERGRVFDPELWAAVGRIVEEVGRRGDEALFEYTARWDGHAVTAATVEASADERTAAAAQVLPEDLEVLRLAAGRIERFHEHQRCEGWSVADEEGVELGQRILPLARVGIYAPGGLACYPSTVLMTAIPARIAGVGEIILVTPSRDGRLHPLIAAAAELGGVNRIFKIGGAQAIAALAFGTAIDSPRGQDRRSGERLCGGRQEDGLRPGRDRHDRRSQRDPDHRRRDGRGGLCGGGSAGPGRA